MWRIDESSILDVYIESWLIFNQVLQKGQCALLFDVWYVSVIILYIIYFCPLFEAIDRVRVLVILHRRWVEFSHFDIGLTAINTISNYPKKSIEWKYGRMINILGWATHFCRGGSKVRWVWAVARTPVQFFCNFLCKSIWISYINPYKLGNFFKFLDYLLAISYVNSYKCVAKLFLSRLYNDPGSATAFL